MQKLHCIIHGRLKSIRKIQENIHGLFSGIMELTIAHTTWHGEAIGLAENAARNGANIVLIAGGDGSVNECINGIISSGNRDTRLAIYPVGSGNDFARYLRIPRDLGILRDWILGDCHLESDLLHCHYRSHTGNLVSRYSNNITDIGLGGVVAEKVHRWGKKLGGNLSYQMAILHTLANYKNSDVRIEVEKDIWEGRVKSLIMANAPFFGSGLCIAPEASAFDGQMELIRIGEVSTFTYLRYLPGIRNCEKLDHPEISYRKCRSVSVDAPEKPLPIDMDGEFIGTTPLTVEVEPRLLKVICGEMDK